MRCFSAVVKPAPPKLILPSNLVIDPKSSFANMYEQQEEEDDSLSFNENDPEDYDDDEEDDEELFLSDSLPYQENVVYCKPLPERLHVEIHTLFRSPSLVGTIHLHPTVFGMDPIRIDLLKRSVDYYRAKKRGRRKHRTKTISEVSGSGRKVRQQKGGGIARAGHSRPPHWRGGAKAHGPKNTTDYGNTKLNKKVRKLALRHVLSQKLKEGNVIFLNQLHELPTHKTGDLARLLEPWNIAGKMGSTALLLDHYYPETDVPEDAPNVPSSFAGIPTHLHAAAGNLPRLTVNNSHGANVYSILHHEKLILTLSALEQIEERLKEE
jgi:large subunit ribosomal protein L4